MKNVITFDPSRPKQVLVNKIRDWNLNYIILDTGFFEDQTDTWFKNSHSNIWLNIPVFCNSGYLETHPNSFALTSQNRQAKFMDWLHFVCPNDEEYFQFLLTESLSVIKRVQPPVISLDFIRTFLFWENINQKDVIEDGCYCPVCLAEFRKEIDTGELLTPEIIQKHHKESWGKWKSRIVTEKAAILIKVFKKAAPEARITMKLIPFTQDENDSSVLWAAGQDIKLLAPLCDFLSPMTFYNILNKDLEWKKQILDYFHKTTKKPVADFSMDQSIYNFEQPISTENFQKELQLCLNLKEKNDWYLGTTIFHFESLINEKEKIELVENISF